MRVTCFLILLLFGSVSFGQQKATIIIKGEDKLEKVLPQEMMYSFSEFSDAKLYLKDGSINSTRININLYTNDILFWNSKNQVMVLSNPEEVTKIVVGDVDWLPVAETFGEVIYSKSSYLLLRAKKTTTSELRKEAGYGGMSSTSSVRSVTSMNTSYRSAEILPVGEYDFETKTSYYISVDANNTIADARGFKKTFSTYKKEIDDFVKTGKINFKTEKDIISMLDFCTGLGK